MSTAVRFRSLSASEVAAVALDGAPLSTLSGEALLAHAHACGLPPLGDDAQTRLVLAALASGTGSSSIASDCWSEMRDEARGMLLLAARRDGVLSAGKRVRARTPRSLARLARLALLLTLTPCAPGRGLGVDRYCRCAQCPQSAAGGREVQSAR